MNPIFTIEEKQKGNKIFFRSPSRLSWTEGEKQFNFEYERREPQLNSTFGFWGDKNNKRERSGAFAHGMLGVNQSKDFFIKIFDETQADKEALESFESALCSEAENINCYYGKDCARVLKRKKEDGIFRYYLIMPKETGEAAIVRIKNVSQASQSHSLAIITQALHPLYVIAQLQTEKNTAFLHRDIKPDNLIWPAEPNVPFKLIDFGFAANTTASINVISKTLPGTRGYLSPHLYDEMEAFDNDRQEVVAVNYKDDHYAMAVTLAKIFSIQYSFPSNINYITYTKKEPAGIGAAPLDKVSIILFHVAQLKDNQFEEFITKNSALGNDQINFLRWIRPFVNGTSENNPAYIEQKLQEFRAQFQLNPSEGIQSYQGTRPSAADINVLSTEKPKSSAAALLNK